MFGEQVGPGLFVKLGIDVEEFKFGLDKARYSLTQWRDETNKSTADLGRWVAAIGATVAPYVALGYAVYNMTEKYGAMAQTLMDLSLTTGFTTAKLQELEYAAVAGGHDFGIAAIQLNYFTKTMGDAADKSTPAWKAFMGLGIDPRGRDPAEVFDETTTAIMEMSSETERAAAMSNLFGRNWPAMLSTMEEYAKQKKKTVIWSEEDIKGSAASKAWLDTTILGLDKQMGRVTSLTARYYDLWQRMDPVTGKIKDIEKAADKTAPALRDLSQDFEAAGKAALKLAADAITARRKLEDLYMSIDENLLNKTEIGMEQKSLGDEYNELMRLKALGLSGEEAEWNAAVAAGFRGSYAGTKRPKMTMAEIDKRLAEIGLQMNKNNLASANAGVKIDRAYEDITVAETPVKTPADYASLLKTAYDMTQQMVDWSQKVVNISIVQNNTGVESDGDALNKAIGKIAAVGGALE